MVISTQPEQIDEVYLQRTGSNACEAVLDGGAQSFVVGEDTLQQYRTYLHSVGINWEPKRLNCDKIFRFGNDDTSHCTVAAIVPVNFAGRTGHLYVHILPGGTPFLFPRPLMDKFGLIVDFGRKRLSWTDTDWTEVRQKDCRGHYLLHLAQDVDHLKAHVDRPQFSYIPDYVTDIMLEIDLSMEDQEF